MTNRWVCGFWFYGGLLAYALIMVGVIDLPERVVEGMAVLTLSLFVIHNHEARLALFPRSHGAEEAEPVGATPGGSSIEPDSSLPP